MTKLKIIVYYTGRNGQAQYFKNQMQTSLRIVSLFLMMGTNVLIAQDQMANAREIMVKTQLRNRGIQDQYTLKAMEKVPRHKFVPKASVPLAYRDGALSIGYGQTISQPYIVAFMTESLQLRSTDKVLEIGTGSGYQAAVLSEIVDSVYSIEIIKELALSAKKLLDTLGYDNVIVRWGDGYHGWPERAPFDAIMVTAGASTIPQPLIDQLKEGGRIIIPVGPPNGITELVRATKKDGKMTVEHLLPVRFVPFTRAE